MCPLSKLADKKISHAINNGDLDCARFKDKPLVFEDDGHVPGDLKMAYKILKNSGYLPPELETRKEIYRLEQMLETTIDEQHRIKQMRKLNLLMMKLDSQRSFQSPITSRNNYYAKIVEKTTLHSQKSAT